MVAPPRSTLRRGPGSPGDGAHSGPCQRWFANTIVNDVNSLSVREALGLHLKILLVVKDHFIRAGFASQLGFFLGADRGDHPRADIFRHLHQKEPDAPAAA